MKKIAPILYFVLSVILVFTLCEFFIRNAKISELSFAEFYNDIGKGIPKEGTYTYFNEGFGITSVNKSRFIGQDIKLEKSKNTIRIALVGDSYVESIQIFERFYFGNIAKTILNEKYLDKDIEILNFGRSEFNIGNMYAYQRLFVDKFAPDYILYFISNEDLNCDYTSPPLLPVTNVINDEIIVSVDRNKNDLNIYQKTKFLTQNSVFFNILNSCRRKIKEGKFYETLFGKFYLNEVEKEVKIKSDQIVKNKITTHIVKSFDPNVIMVNKGGYPLLSNFLKECLENEIQVLDLKKPLDSLIKIGVNPYYWAVTNKKGHWNPKAHKAIGVFLAKEIDNLIIEGIKKHKPHRN